MGGNNQGATLTLGELAFRSSVQKGKCHPGRKKGRINLGWVNSPIMGQKGEMRLPSGDKLR